MTCSTTSISGNINQNWPIYLFGCIYAASVARQFRSNFLESLEEKAVLPTVGQLACVQKRRSSFRASSFIIPPFTHLCFFTNFDFYTWRSIRRIIRDWATTYGPFTVKKICQTDKTKKALLFPSRGTCMLTLKLRRCRGKLWFLNNHLGSWIITWNF